jgi:hypothetical protein
VVKLKTEPAQTEGEIAGGVNTGNGLTVKVTLELLEQPVLFNVN